MAEPRGVSFPFRLEAGNFPLMATGNDLIRSRLTQVLMTEPGERRMRPKYGCRLRGFLFDPQDDPTKMAIQSEVFRAIRDSGINVAVLDIAVTFENTDSVYKQSFVAITITYESLGQQDSISLTVGG